MLNMKFYEKIHLHEKLYFDWRNVVKCIFFTYEANISTKKTVFISKILFKKHHADNETSFVRITSIDHCAKTEQGR